MPTKRKAEPKGLAPAKATSGDVAAVLVGSRYSRRTALRDQYGPQLMDSETHHLLRPAKLKAWALQVLHAAGVDTDGLRVEHEHQNEGAFIRERVACTILRPLELAEDATGAVRVVAGRGYEHDDLPMLAARIYELAREVELAAQELDPGARAAYAGRAYAIGYELGRLSMLARVYGFDAEAGARGGAPAKADHEAVRRYHARLDGERDATSQTAAAFNLSTRQVRYILKANPKARPT